MRKKLIGSLIAAVLVATIFTGCGNKKSDQVESDKKILKYGKSQGPYTILFEEAVKPILEEKGYTLNAVDFSDLAQNDTALDEGEIDFNVEQHRAYAENFNATHKANLAPVYKVPTVPAGIFSKTHTSIDEIASGAKIVVPNDASNTARAVLLLKKAGWITINESVEPSKASVDDIVENPYNIQITEIDSINIPNVLDEFDYAVIPGSVVYNAGMDASTVLLQEDVLDHLILQLVVKEDNKDTQWVKDIIAAYESTEFKTYMEKNNQGLWFIPDNTQSEGDD